MLFALMMDTGTVGIYKREKNYGLASYQAGHGELSAVMACNRTAETSSQTNTTAFVAYNWENGKISWWYDYKVNYPYETPYGDNYPWFTGTTTIADGVIYTYNTEHSPSEPIMRGEKLHAINATRWKRHMEYYWFFGSGWGSRRLLDGGQQL